MKTCPNYGYGVEVLESLLYALSLPDPRTLLCVTFLWGYVKDKVCATPLPVNIDDMKDRITVTINTVNRDMLRCVWDEFSYRLDVVRAADGGHIEHLTKNKVKFEGMHNTCA